MLQNELSLYRALYSRDCPVWAEGQTTPVRTWTLGQMTAFHAGQSVTYPIVPGSPSLRAGPMQLLVAAQDSDRPFAQV